MIPEISSVTHLIQSCDPHSVFIRLDMLRFHIHCDLAQIQITSDPSCCCDPCAVKHILYDRGSKTLRCHLICVQIIGHIHKNLIDRIHMHILRCYIFQIDIINPCTVLHVIRHPRRCCNIPQRQLWIRRQLCSKKRLSLQTVSRCLFSSLRIDTPDCFNHFKKSGTSRYPIAFQGRRDRQTYCFLCSTGIGNNKVRGERIQSPLHTLHRCIK